MITLNSRQETIKNTIEPHFQENLELFESECEEVEYEMYLQDYAKDNYISENDWNNAAKKAEYLQKLKDGNKKAKPVSEKKFVKSEKQIGQVDKVFDKAKKYINFETIANQYGLVLTDGSDGWKNCCCPLPEHDDSSPSFGINFKSQTFNCFGCHEHGDVIKFIAMMEEIEPIDVAKSIVAENENVEDKIEIRSLTIDNIEDKLNELLFTPDGQIEATKMDCDKLANELGTKVNLLLRNDIANMVKYQKVICEVGMVLSRYVNMVNEFSFGIGSKKNVMAVHKLLVKINDRFLQVK